ncbi:MAG: ROK family protein [Bacillota bacterium]
MAEPVLTSDKEICRTPSEYALGIDVGGTKTIITAMGLDEVVLKRGRFATAQGGDPLEAAWLVTLVSTFLQRTGLRSDRLKALAIGVPGAVDMMTGHVSLAPNLGWMEPYPLRQLLEDALGIPVLVDNDVNMAAIGEQRYGIAKGVKDFVFVAVGTGIGAGIVIDNRVYRGSHWTAGEVGYMVLSEDCLGHTYRDHGYLESRASGKGVVQMARDLSIDLQSLDDRARHLHGDLQAERVFHAASRGNATAQKVVDQALSALGLGLANIATLLDPQLIVLGGGVLKNAAILKPLDEAVHRLVPTKADVVLSRLGTEAQVLGAAATALQLAKGEAVGADAL